MTQVAMPGTVELSLIKYLDKNYFSGNNKRRVFICECDSFSYGSKVHRVFKWENIDKSYYVVITYKVHSVTFEIGVTLINKGENKDTKGK